MAKFASITILLCCFIFGAIAEFPGTNWYQRSLAYRPYKSRAMYRVIPQTSGQMENLMHFVAHPDIVIWSPITHAQEPVDILIPRNQVSEILQWLRGQGMNPMLLDKSVIVNFSNNRNYEVDYPRLPYNNQQQGITLKNDLSCRSSDLDMNDCRSTPCITYFDQASSTCERWISSDKTYTPYKDEKDSCFMGLLHIVTCCKCRNPY